MRENSVNIKEYKIGLRKQFRSARAGLSSAQKQEMDEKIFQRLIQNKVFQRAQLVLTYVSTPIEVDTARLLEFCWKNGKAVAAPRCIDGTREMNFYRIESWTDLETGTFSVLEPNPELCRIQESFDNAVCIVPGLAFDMQGYRLGYGKGYYDRFLNRISGLYNIGICYCSCTVNRLIHGRFDVPVHTLITEKYTKNLNLSERSSV